jgi:DNA polymerase-3 subunit epsilon
MRALFFDTETTGLPKQRNRSATEDPNNWPEPVSISWIVTQDSKILRAKSYIVKPGGWTIPEESVQIHGIPQDLAVAQGLDLNTILGEFIRDLRSVDVVVAHNLDFDKNVMTAASIRLKHDHALLWPQLEFCTMESSRVLCKIPLLSQNALFKFKSPKLSELYKHLFGQDPQKLLLHSSLGDVMILYTIFFTQWTLEQVASYAREGKQNLDPRRD